ncbi:hypothetical protein QC762_400830 [Podospora pseudocomata]|uniref:DNL-type domain-containing protein n=1 Tax=Podospora pseudocomata TaxID=2093779 RepID=A0ABR0GE69_9PEZI|nr:hypothetical protein QC762_400830 [Podospora pseudocomata]
MLTFSSSRPTRQPARGVCRPHEIGESNLNSACQNSFNTIKTAMAAGLGSSLFLFQGLSSISPRILTEASLPSPTFPPSSTYQEEDRGSMGNSKSKPSRESKPNSRFSRLSTTALVTSPVSASKRTKPEYKLKVICSNCARKNLPETACHTANDINANGGSNLAFQEGSSYYENQELKSWKLEIDCCGWSKTREEGVYLVEKHMKNAQERGRPISVDEVLVKLEEGGIAHRSNVAKRVYKPRGQDNAQRPRGSQAQQQQQQQQPRPQSHPQPQQQLQQRTRQGWSQQSWHQGVEYQYPGRR